MTHIIIQRTFLSFILFLVFLLVVKSYSAYNEWRVRRKKRLPLTIETGKPVLLYF